MPAKPVKTKTPGVYRRGDRYTYVYRVNGKQRWGSARTYDEARRRKSEADTEAARGGADYMDGARLPFGDYAREWIDRYQGAGKGFRDETREAYRLLLNIYALPYFDKKLGRKLGQITPRDIANFVAWLCEQRTKGTEAKPGKPAKPGRPLSDATIRKATTPLRACLATAVREGLIRHNPARDVALPNRTDRDDLEDDEVRALTRAQLDAFLKIVHPNHRLLFKLLAATGLRISEAIGLQWRHVRLDGSTPQVRVRRRIVHGNVGPPKSKRSRRDVPLPPSLVRELRIARAGSEADALVFASKAGTPLNINNVRRRYLQPAAEEAGASWAGFHTFRHSCASMLFERGANAKQVQRWLGHSSAAFTLATYVHLLGDDLGAPLDLTVELARANKNANETYTTEHQSGEADDAAIAHAA